MIKVLIVDDDEIDRYILKRLLAKSPRIADIYEVQDGQAALELFEASLKQTQGKVEKIADLVFLDINMPRKNGFEFLEALSRMAANNPAIDLPAFVMYSSSDRADDRAQALAYDCVKHYLTKEECQVERLEDIISTFSQETT